MSGLDKVNENHMIQSEIRLFIIYEIFDKKIGTFCQVHLYHKYTYLSLINDPKLHSKSHLRNSFAEGRVETSEDSASNALRF